MAYKDIVSYEFNKGDEVRLTDGRVGLFVKQSLNLDTGEIIVKLGMNGSTEEREDNRMCWFYIEQLDPIYAEYARVCKLNKEKPTVQGYFIANFPM